MIIISFKIEIKIFDKEKFFLRVVKVTFFNTGSLIDYRKLIETKGKRTPKVLKRLGFLKIFFGISRLHIPTFTYFH